MDIDLRCDNEEGAALIVKGPTSHFHARFPDGLRNSFLGILHGLLVWIELHYPEPIKVDDLLLVTGVDLVTAWAMATFHGRNMRCSFNVHGGRLDLPVNVSLGGWFAWSRNTSLPIRQGPSYRPGGNFISSLEEFRKQSMGKDDRNGGGSEDEGVKEDDMDADAGNDLAHAAVVKSDETETPVFSRDGKGKQKEVVEVRTRDPRSPVTNQCVFLKAHRFARRDILFRKLKGGAEPQDPDYDSSDDVARAAPVRTSGMDDPADTAVWSSAFYSDVNLSALELHCYVY